MTKGEYRVGITFNPSNADIVYRIKRAGADLIDLMEEIPIPETHCIDSAYYSNEVARLRSIAQTDIETAVMYAVKAATKKPKCD